MLESFLFYPTAAVTLLSALAVVSLRKPLYAVLALLVTLSGLATFFILQGAYFLGILQLLIYAGAILILFLFVVMLLNLENSAVARSRPWVWRSAGWLLGAALVWTLWPVLAETRPAAEALPLPPDGRVAAVGRALLTTYLLPFEVTSLLLLIAIVGAVTLVSRGSADRSVRAVPSARGSTR